jgi:2-keto-4-pentenoate hydratase
MTSAITAQREQVAEAASRLAEAAATGIPCTPVRDLIGTDPAAAYAVQQCLLDRRIAAGATVVGRKIGLTAAAVQQQLGVDRPDFGVLFEDMAVPDGGIADMSRLLQPKVEAEVAFMLAADIDDPDASSSSVRGAVAYAVAALEIVDSRIAGWDISYADTVADNASSGLYVLGSQLRALEEVEPREVTMALRLNGEKTSSGSGAGCLGDPLAALAWLARTAAEFGSPLRAGQIVLSGALGRMVDVGAGDRVDAEITGLGGVSVAFGTPA